MGYDTDVARTLTSPSNTSWLLVGLMQKVTNQAGAARIINGII